MPVAPYQIIGLGARYEEALMVSVSSVSWIFLAKAPVTPGLPQRELELFTLAEAIAAQVGPYFWDLRPRRIEVLQQDFFLMSGLDRGGGVVRLFWCPVTESITRTVKYIDINIGNLHAEGSGGASTTGFEGIDPFIMDARTVDHPDRLYLVYVLPDGSNCYRISNDFGFSWEGEVTFDPVMGQPPVRFSECNFLDPLGIKENVQVLQQRDNG